MKSIFTGILLVCVGLISKNAWAEDRIELETTTIKGNAELPKYLYVVPWQDKKVKNKEEQKLVLHNLYGDLFDPVMPNYIQASDYQLKLEPEKQ